MPRAFLPGAALALAAATLAVLVADPLPASASVFNTDKRWATTPRPGGGTGFALIPICIMNFSSVQQRNMEDPNGYITDANPSFDRVLREVRDALRSSWESYGAVRFVGWRNCSELSAEERARTVGFYINPLASNASVVGTDAVGALRQQFPGVSIKPWGSSADPDQCIRYDTLWFHYDFACAREYATHEFGRVAGFVNEWYSPATPEGCLQSRGDHRLPPGTYSSTLDPSFPFMVTNPADYDWNSVLVYGDACANVSGVRFGSPTLSEKDRTGLATAYPFVRDVGVLAHVDRCGSAENVAILLDDENDGNQSSSSGWTGISSTEPRGTLLRFCRADGERFRPARQGYAVLKLGQACPSGSYDVTRVFDNEDQSTRNAWSDADAAWPNGERRRFKHNIVPSMDMALTFCVFPPRTDGAALPVLGHGYGVLAAPDFPRALAAGTIHIDDENDDNQNEPSAPIPGLSSLLETGEDTTLHVVQIAGAAPLVSSIPDQTTREDVPLPPIAFFVDDLDSPVETLTATVRSSNEALVPARNLVLGAAGRDRTLAVTPVPDGNGETTIEIAVCDGNEVTTRRFHVRVTPVNDPVSLAPIADQAIAEDARLSVPLGLTDADTDDTWTFVLGSSNRAVVADDMAVERLGGGGHELHVRPVRNASGQTRISIRVTDGGGVTVARDFLLAVSSVNDVPGVAWESGEQIDEAPGNLRVRAWDEDGDPLTYEWTSLVRAIFGNGASATLDGGAGEGFDRADMVSVRVCDTHGACATEQRLVFVRNMPPVVEAPDRAGYWGLPISLAARVTDPSPADNAAGFAMLWVFGDGSSAWGEPSHTYALPGIYAASVGATDRDGAQSDDGLTVTVLARPTSLAAAWPTSAPFGFAEPEARLHDEAAVTHPAVIGREVVFAVAGQTIAAATGAGAAAGAEPSALAVEGLPGVLVRETARAVPSPPLPPGTHEVIVTFAGDRGYVTSETRKPITVVNSKGRVEGNLRGDAGPMAVSAQSDGQEVSGTLDFPKKAPSATARLQTLGLSPDGRAAWLGGVTADSQAVLVYLEDNDAAGGMDLFRVWLNGGLFDEGSADVRIAR